MAGSKVPAKLRAATRFLRLQADPAPKVLCSFSLENFRPKSKSNAAKRLTGLVRSTAGHCDAGFVSMLLSLRMWL
jgi:hypothetical protein